MLVLHGLLNTFGIRLVALLNDVSVWWHVAGVLIVMLDPVFIVPDQHTSFSTIFSCQHSRPTADGTAVAGASSTAPASTDRSFFGIDARTSS